MEPGFFQITLKVFLHRGNEFLVLRDRAAQVGDLPGGRISHAEFFQPWGDCVRRELAEELGSDFRYDLNEEPAFIFPHYIISAKTDGLGIAFLAEYLGGEIRLSDEHDDMNWVSAADYNPDDYFAEHMAAAVRRYQREFVAP